MKTRTRKSKPARKPRTGPTVEVARFDDEAAGGPRFVPAGIVQDRRREITVTMGAKKGEKVGVNITEQDFEHRTVWLSFNVGGEDFDGVSVPPASIDQFIAALTTARDKAQELGLLTPRALPKPFYLDQGSAAV